MDTAEPLVSEPSAFEVELTIEKLKNHKSRGIDQIRAEMTKEGGRTIHYKIHKLFIFIWDKEELPEEWKNSIIVPVYTTDDKQIVVIIGAYKRCHLCTKSYPKSNCQG
jgi:hypothetical protein